MSVLLWPLAALVLGYLGLCVLLFVQQRRLLFRPTRELLDPARLGDGFERIEVASADGLTLAHLWRPPGGDSTAPCPGVLLAFHGNAGNAGERAGKLREVLPAGWGLLLAEYRGYAGNPGAPSEAGLQADAAGVLSWLGERGFAAGRVVLYGESLGSGVATRLAAEQAARGAPVAGLVLEAPFTSIAEAAQQHYWYVPARWLVRDRFDSLARIAAAGAPLLILHGRLDAVVPYAMAGRLLAAAREPKRLFTLEQGRHADLYEQPGTAETVRAFLEQRAGAGATQGGA